MLKYFMDVSVVNPFLKAAINMFESMFNFTPTYGKPFIVSPEGNHRWEISGVIGIVGDSEGLLILRVTKLFALKLLQNSGVEVTDKLEQAQVMREMISELVNIISGNALRDIKDKNIEITPPLTIQGVNHTISWPANTPIIGVPFFSSFGSFEMQISVNSIRDDIKCLLK